MSSPPLSTTLRRRGAHVAAHRGGGRLDALPVPARQRGARRPGEPNNPILGPAHGTLAARPGVVAHTCKLSRCSNAKARAPGAKLHAPAPAPHPYSPLQGRVAGQVIPWWMTDATRRDFEEDAAEGAADSEQGGKAADPARRAHMRGGAGGAGHAWQGARFRCAVALPQSPAAEVNAAAGLKQWCVPHSPPQRANNFHGGPLRRPLAAPLSIRHPRAGRHGRGVSPGAGAGGGLARAASPLPVAHIGFTDRFHRPLALPARCPPLRPPSPPAA